MQALLAVFRRVCAVAVLRRQAVTPPALVEEKSCFRAVPGPRSVLALVPAAGHLAVLCARVLRAVLGC